MSRRVRWIVLSVSAVLSGLGAAVAIAAISSPTSIGDLEGRMTSAVYNSSEPRLWVQVADPAGRSYAVPDGGGVITRWGVGLFRVTGTGGTVGLRVMRPGSGTSVYVVAGADDRDVTPDESPRIRRFGVRIPVRGGDRLGVAATQEVWIGSDYPFPAASVATLPSRPAAGETVTLQSGYDQVDTRLEAEIEPDADGDGFGDATQDGCPGEAARQAAPCAGPPTVTVTAPAPAGPSGAAGGRACVVPPLRGLSRASASKALRRFGCRLGKVRAPKARRGVRLIVTRSPAPGTRLAENAAVDVRLGRAPRRR